MSKKAESESNIEYQEVANPEEHVYAFFRTLVEIQELKKRLNELQENVNRWEKRFPALAQIRGIQKKIEKGRVWQRVEAGKVTAIEFANSQEEAKKKISSKLEKQLQKEDKLVELYSKKRASEEQAELERRTKKAREEIRKAKEAIKK